MQVIDTIAAFRKALDEERIKVVQIKVVDEEQIKVVSAAEDRIDFTRTNRLSRCSTRHDCALEGGDRLLCKVQTQCPRASAGQVVWRGEERYARRASCERDGKRQQQGIPVRCR